MTSSMKETGEYLVNQRLKHQLVYPFLEIDYQPLKNKCDRQIGGDNIVEVIETTRDRRLLSIKEVSDLY